MKAYICKVAKALCALGQQVGRIYWFYSDCELNKNNSSKVMQGALIRTCRFDYRFDGKFEFE